MNRVMQWRYASWNSDFGSPLDNLRLSRLHPLLITNNTTIKIKLGIDFIFLMYFNNIKAYSHKFLNLKNQIT